MPSRPTTRDDSRTGADQQQSFAGWSDLTRAPSHRDLYDAHTSGGIDSEFAFHSRDHHELVRQTSASTDRRAQAEGTINFDDPHFHRSISSKARRATSEAQQPQQRPQQQQQPSQTEELLDQVDQYEKEDAAAAAVQARELERVRSGASGRTAAQVTGSADVDLEQGSPDIYTTRSSLTASTRAPTRTPSANASEKLAAEVPDPASGKAAEAMGEEEEHDPFLVTWDSPTSQENPRNWSKAHKRAVVAVVSSYTFLSPCTSSMIAPALPLISQDFGITSSAERSMTLSVFILAYAVGPLFLAPLSEMYGRRVVLQTSNVFFLIFTLVCGFAQTSAQLIVFRFLSGLGGSAPLSIGGGLIGDLYTSDQRGTAMAIYSLAPLLGPCIGPIIGGWITQSLNVNRRWAWIFFVLVMFGALVAIVGLIILPETYQPRILEIKCAKLKKETGNDKLHTIFQLEKQESFSRRMRRNLARPFVLLATQPIVQAFACLMALVYGVMYLLLTSFSEIFSTVYDEPVGISSLNYISLGIGFTLGGQVGGRVIDRIYKHLKEKNNGVGRPEFKLPLLIVGVFVLPIGSLIFGWTAQYRTHWIVPNIGAAILGIGLMLVFLGVQNYLVDSYAIYAASALSTATFLRSLAGFGFPLFAPAMFEALDYGPGTTLLAGIIALVGIPSGFLLYRYGDRIRARSNYSATGAIAPKKP